MQNKDDIIKSMNSGYVHYVQNRSRFAFFRGLVSRLLSYLRYEHYSNIARRKGASIGKHVVLNKAFAKKCNSNVRIGDHVSIETDRIDTRAPISIGNYVIIGKGTEIISVSHNIDSPNWEPKYYGITIEDYVWIPTNVLVLPSCRKIEYGAVIGSGSVVIKNVGSMSVVSGNPALEFKKRECVHSQLVVESLRHGDFCEFWRVYKMK